MPEAEDDMSVPVFPTLIQKSIRNEAMLETLLLIAGELLAKSRGISNEDMMGEIYEDVDRQAKEIVERLEKSSNR